MAWHAPRRGQGNAGGGKGPAGQECRLTQGVTTHRPAGAQCQGRAGEPGAGNRPTWPAARLRKRRISHRPPTGSSLRRVPRKPLGTAWRTGTPLDYIYWLLRTPECRDYCRAHATGTTNLGLSRADFLAFPVPPATPERLRLVDVLTTLDDKIELNRRMNATLEAMAQALFRSWFVDFDPVRAKMEGRNTGLPPDIADLFPGPAAGLGVGGDPRRLERRNSWRHRRCTAPRDRSWASS